MNPYLLIDRFIHQSETMPERIAYTYLADKDGEPESFTYASLDRKAKAIAAELQSRGAEGERALLLFPSGLEFIASFLGCLYAGVIAVPAYPPRKNGKLDRIENIIADCRATIILTTEPIRKMMEHQFAELLTPEQTLLTYETLPDENAAAWQRPALLTGAIAFLQYTSGSTGIPKGVMVGHDNLLANLEDLALGSDHTTDSVMVSWLPAFHDLGLIAGILLTIYNGATCYLMSPVAFMVKPTRWMKAASDYKATHTVAPNFAFEQSLLHTNDALLAELDLSNLAYLGNCAEPIKAETLIRFQEMFAKANLNGAVIKPGYGLAEATLKVTASKGGPTAIQYLDLNTEGLEQHKIIPQLSGGRRFVGCGTSEIDTVVRIVNPATKRSCSANEVGEIWVAGRTVAYGYWERPEQTEEVFRAYLADTGEGPFLRTGDLGFQWNDELFVTGRIKDLVIINGKNHYPQDIEKTVERAHPALRKGCTAAFAIDGDQGEQLVIVQEIASPSVKQLDVESVTALIRERVGEEHALGTAAIVLIEPASIPKTSSGKIQRRECKRRYLASMLPVLGVSLEAAPNGVSYVAPRTPGEIELQTLWQSVLGQSPVSIQANFFALGGNSIKAVRLTSAINDHFKTNLSTRDLFDYPTIEALVQRIEEGGGAVECIEILPSSRYYPVSASQKSMWLLEQYEQATGAYNITVRYGLQGCIDQLAFQASWTLLVQRYEVLRTRFVERQGEILQTIEPELTFVPEWIDWRSEPGQSTQIEALSEAENKKAFDLTKAPLFRVKVVLTNNLTASLLLTIHHSIADEWSLNVLLVDFLTTYTALTQRQAPMLNPLRIHYKEFVNWQQQRLDETRGRAAAEYWQNEFTPIPAPLALPTDFPRQAVKTYRGSAIGMQCSAEQTEALQAFSQAQGTTLFMILLSGLQTLLHRYTGQDDIVIGTPVAGREHSELLNQVGCYINTLALRQRVDPDQTVTAHLAEVHRHTATAFAYQQYPFEALLELLPGSERNRSPLFDVMLVLYNSQNALLGDDGQPLRITSSQLVTNHSKYDLTIYAKERPDGLVLELVYNADLFTNERAQYILDHYSQLLNWLVANPNKTIGEAEYLTETERIELTETFSQNAQASLTAWTLAERFEQIAGQHPDQRAVVFQNETLTYRQLNERANQLAHLLEEMGIGRESRVAIRVPRSADLVVGLLAILKTGATYLPIDTTCPPDRLTYLLRDSGSALLLTNEPVAGVGELPIVLLNSHSYANRPIGNRLVEKAPTQPVYIIYTSGSTGWPKGVIVAEAALRNYVQWFATTYQLTPADSTLLLSSVAFDLSYTSLWPSLLSGCTLFVLPEETYFDGGTCLSMLAENGITYLKLTPSHFGLLLDQVDFVEKAEGLALRLIVLGGEKIRPDDLSRFCLVRPTGTRFVNHYGPTETTIGTVAQTIDPEETVAANDMALQAFAQRPVIGRPIANAAAYIVDEKLRVQGVGIWGELCIAGSGLALGYLGNLDLTAQKFVNRPFGSPTRMYRTGDIARWLPNGRIELLGRIDTQVKLRGYRVELGEIEQVLRRYPAVSEAAVAVKNDVLVAYYNGQAVIETESLRRHVAAQLPDYMVPTAYVALMAFPLLGNGKIDRNQLPEPTDEQLTLTDHLAPQNDCEQALVTAVASVLGRKQVSLNDDFFRIGGDSIKAMQVVSVLYQAGYQLGIRDLFRDPVLANVAMSVTAIRQLADQGAITGAVALTPIQYDFFARRYVRAHQYNQAVLLASDERLDAEFVQQVIDALLNHHDALRTVFTQAAGEVAAFIPERSEVELMVQDLQTEANATERLTKEAQAVQESINLSVGPLFKAVLFRLNDGDRLLLVSHHLVIDGVSWRILLADFGRAYRALRAGHALTLPYKTESYLTWSNTLRTYAQSPSFTAERSYWESIDALSLDSPFAPTQLPAKIIQVSCRATPGQTAQFRDRASQANELLLTALNRALEKLCVKGRYRVMIEGHGREDVISPVNVSRTVGWFTSLYPAVFDTNTPGSNVDQYAHIQEVLAAVPNKGVGYGIYQYLSPETTARSRKSAICFNYLGDFTESLSDSGLTLAGEDTGATQYAGEQPLYDLSVVGMIRQEALNLDFYANNACLTAENLTDLATEFMRTLSAILAEQHVETKATVSKSTTWREIEALPQQPYYPASQAQRRLWFLHQLEESPTAYNMVRGLRLEGTLNQSAFEAALSGLVGRHESLRTNIVNVGGTPVLQIRPYQPEMVTVNGRDFRNEPAADQLAADFFRTAADTPFDLSADVLVRFNLVRLGEETHLFQYVIHHSIADGWSLNTLYGELMEAYAMLAAGNMPANQPLRIQYKEFVAWQNEFLVSPDVQQQRRYWAQQLAGQLPVLQLPTDQVRAVNKTYQSAGHTVTLGAELSQRVRQYAALASASSFTVLLSGVQALLHRYSGQNELIIGTPVAGRNHPALHNQVGLFLNTLPIRVTVDPQETFESLLGKTRRTVQEALMNQDYPFDRIVEELNLLRDVSRSPLFDVMVIHEEFPTIHQRWSGLKVSNYDVDFYPNKYDLTIYFQEAGGQIIVRIEYNRTLFSAERIAGMGRHLTQIMTGLLSENGATISEVGLLTDEETEDIFRKLNRTDTNFTQQQVLHTLFEQRVTEQPFADAVRQRGSSLTYHELNRRANALARYIRTQGVRPGQCVGIVSERSSELIIGLMAVLKAGAFYVPVEAAAPVFWRNGLLLAADVRLILTDTGILSALPTGMLAAPLWHEEYNLYDDTNLLLPIIHTETACVLPALNTAGEPVGMQVTHQAIANLVHWVNTTYGLLAGEKALFVRPLSAGLSLYDMFGMLTNGGTVVIAARDEIRNDQQLKTMLIDEKITVWNTVPATVAHLLSDPLVGDELAQDGRLKTILLSGDVVPTKLTTKFAAILPTTTWVWAGAANEGAVWSSFRELLPLAGEISSRTLGRPIPNTYYYVLDKHQNWVPQGVVGELYIGGIGVSPGFLGDETATETAFSVDPFETPWNQIMVRTGDRVRMMPDGTLDYTGNADGNERGAGGYRINTRGIAARIRRYTGLTDASVRMAAKLGGTTQLLAYYTADSTITSDELRKYLLEYLPDYLIPTLLIQVEKLSDEYTENAASVPQSGNQQPRSMTEESLLLIWQRLLNSKNIGLKDDFFALGGHSLLIWQMSIQIEESLGVKVPLKTIFAHPTIEQLAAEVEARLWVSRTPDSTSNHLMKIVL